MCGSPFYPHSTRRVILDQTDVCLLRELERGLPLVPAPFEEIGKRLDLNGDEVMERIRHLKEAGIIRKLRARIDQRKVGISANALVAWKTTHAGDGDMGKLLAAFPSVTHCYERRPVRAGGSIPIIPCTTGTARIRCWRRSGLLQNRPAVRITSSSSAPGSSNACRT